MDISFTELNVYEVVNFHKEILIALESNNDSFILNFQNVEKIDLNNIQLLLSLKKYCDKHSIKLQLTNVNTKQIKQTFKMFNLYSSWEVIS